MGRGRGAAVALEEHRIVADLDQGVPVRGFDVPALPRTEEG